MHMSLNWIHVDITLQNQTFTGTSYIQDIALFQFSTASWLPLKGTRDDNRLNPPVFLNLNLHWVQVVILSKIFHDHSQGSGSSHV